MTPVVSGLLWGALALVAGTAVAARLGSRAYRLPEDEVRGSDRAPWWLAVVAGAAGFAVGHVAAGLAAALPATLTAASVWMAGLSAVDLDVRRLPDTWTLGGLGAGLLLLGWCSLAVDDGGRWVEAVGCALASGALHLLLAVVRPSGLGLGDVKLAMPLAALLGWFGWPLAVVGAVGAFLVGVVVGVVVAVRTRTGRGATFPFGPSMMVSAWAVALLATATLA